MTRFAMSATIPFPRDRATAREAVPCFVRRSWTHDDAKAWHWLGQALMRLGDRPGALAAFRHAIRLDDSQVESHVALGNLLFDSGQCERALCCFGRVDGAPPAKR